MTEGIYKALGCTNVKPEQAYPYEEEYGFFPIVGILKKCTSSYFFFHIKYVSKIVNLIKTRT